MFTKKRSVRYTKSVAQRMERRRFAQALGAGLLVTPFVELLRSGDAVAAPGAAKRVVIVMTGGTNLNEWRCTGSSDQKLVTNGWNDGLDRVKDKIVVVESLDGGTGAHGSYHCLVPSGSSWAGPSVDRIIADHLVASGVSTSLPSLLLGAEIEDGKSYFRDGGSAQTINNASSALNLVFGGVAPSTDTGNEAQIAAEEARRQSMLDTVAADLNELHAMLGVEERPKLEAHLESLRQYESRVLGGGPTADGCVAPTGMDTSDSIQTLQAQMELARATAACDLSRVIGVQWGQHNQLTVNLPEIDVIEDLHGLHHGPNKQDILGRYESWFSHQFADFVESFAATADPLTGGSLLDSTLIVWGRGMGDAVNHTSTDSRLVFAGGPSILQNSADGRYIDAGGQPYAKGLAAIGSAMGVTDEEELGGETPLSNVLV